MRLLREEFSLLQILQAQSPGHNGLGSKCYCMAVCRVSGCYNIYRQTRLRSVGLSSLKLSKQRPVTLPIKYSLKSEQNPARY